jgi:hypothetical protein
MHDVLKAIHSKPGMYFGDGRQPFTSFVAFVSGYNIGRKAAHQPQIGLPDDLVPRDFDQFVCRHFGVIYGQDSKGWMTRIQERTASEQEAFDLLFHLLESYESGHLG